MKDCPVVDADEIIDASGKIVLPAWCDSHTHLVYAGDRTLEFVDRINGLTYEEIANRGGGILNSAKKLQNTSEDDLFEQSLERLAEEKLAQYIDVFCEKGYFGLDETEQVLKAGTAYGLIPKIHVNQFNAFGGVALGIKYGALSVDHLEELNPEDIEALKQSDTIPVALPACSYFLSIPYTPARELIDAGLSLALATDYNPGSSPSGNMNFVVSTACIKMKMTPEEAINAATINGAYAMGISETYGSITKGKKANVIITKEIPGYQYLPYAFGNDHIDTVIINGVRNS
jgi:imidazolonepropionase